MSASAVANSLMIRYADRWGFLPLQSLDDSLVGTQHTQRKPGPWHGHRRSDIRGTPLSPDPISVQLFTIQLVPRFPYLSWSVYGWALDLRVRVRVQGSLRAVTSLGC
jgi:hypothetical protein